MNDSKNPNADQIEEMIESIVEWMSKQPHLPQIGDKTVIRKFLINCKYRLQKTKTKIESYYSARTSLPSVFQNRDPSAEEIRACAKNTPFFPLPKRTKNGQMVIIVQMSADPDEFIPADYMKRMFMVFDTILCEEEGRMDYIVVVDFRNFSFRHFLKLTIVAKSIMDIMENVIPARLKGTHYINVHSFVDKVAEFFRMLVKPKLRERMVVHSKIETFYEILGDKNILPTDIGGKEPPIAELSAQHQKKIESYKSWFEKEDKIRSNEDLRPPSSNNSWLMGTEGSFKRLTVD